MPLYEYRCRTCDARFEARRPVDQADASLACPQGHLAATRLLSVFATTGRADPGPAACGAPVAGTCGAGACACG